jgi:hypothetical protein
MLDRDLQEHIAGSHQQPHVLMRPRVFPDGNEWCALYGDNLQDGVAGFGITPQGACDDFDKAWLTAPALAAPKETTE